MHDSDTSKTQSRRQARLILADDHHLLRKGFQGLLAGEPDLEVVGEASNGREAIELCHSLRPDLVLMDVVLPSMNGVTLAEHIAEAIPRVRILFMSGLTSESGVPLRTIRGMPCGFLLKPLGLDALARGVRDLLDGEPDGLRAG